MNKEFNLLDEPWILLSNGEEVGLLELFQRYEEPILLGGNAVEQISMFKLLLAISQISTFVTLTDYKRINNEKFSGCVCAYLRSQRDKFNLYCENNPFLQHAGLNKAKKVSYRALSPHKVEPQTNSVVTSHLQLLNDSDVTDAMLARLLVQQMSFSFAGKKTDRDFAFKGDSKVNSAAAGPGLLFYGAMHAYVQTRNIVETLRLNLFQIECFNTRLLVGRQADLSSVYSKGMGHNHAPWEVMPENANGKHAQHFKQTLMGRLVPVSRFCLLDPIDKNIHFASGLDHPNYITGVFDPTHIAFDQLPKPRILWCDTDKKPCRYISNVFAYLGEPSAATPKALQVQQAIFNMQQFGVKHAELVFIGMQCATSTGETVVGGKSGYVLSRVVIDPSQVGEHWYARVKSLWDELEYCTKKLYGVTVNYHEKININGAVKSSAIEKTSLFFWRGAEQIMKYAIGKIDNNPEITPDEIEFIQHVEKSLVDLATKSFAQLKPENGKHLSEYLLYEFYLKNKSNAEEAVVEGV